MFSMKRTLTESFEVSLKFSSAWDHRSKRIKIFVVRSERWWISDFNHALYHICSDSITNYIIEATYCITATYHTMYFGLFPAHKIHRVHPMCNPPMCNIVPNVQHFFEEFVFCLVSPMCNSQEKFKLQNDKN